MIRMIRCPSLPIGGTMPTKEAPGPKVVVENVNVPGYTSRVDAEHYEAMKAVLLRILSKEGVGLTQTEMFTNARDVASPKRFPDAGKVSWWVKCVHLDLEAKASLRGTGPRSPMWCRRLK